MSTLFKSLVLLGLLAGSYAESQWCNVASDSTGKYLTAIGYACTRVLISDDFGATWQYTKAPTQYWSSLYSDPTGQHLVIGPHYNSQPTATQYSMYSLDRGLTWTVGTYNNAADSSVTISQKIAGDSKAAHLVVVDDWHRLMHSRDGGAQWFALDNVPSNKTVGATNAFAATISGSGSVMYAVNDIGAIYGSVNAGVSWSLKKDVCSDCGGTWKNFVTDNSGTYLFAQTAYQVHASLNGGTSFTKILDHTSTGSLTQVIDIATDSAAKYVYILCLDGLYVYTRSTGTVVKNALKMVVNQGFGAYGVAASTSGQHIILSVQAEGLYVSDDFGNTWRNIRGL